MNLNQWLNYIESLHDKVIDYSLDRVLKLGQMLQLTQFPVPVITVTGTNGKGSTVAFLESIYRHAGYRTASYTSPHLIRFNERIKINNQEIDDKNLILAFEQIEKSRQNLTLSFFEFTTLAALWLFKNLVKPDVIILEVGLGGRLDATNVVDADIAVITSIAIDHSDLLGNTRSQIAFEKAGIMRTNKIAICGDINPPETLIDHAIALKTQLLFKNKDFYLIENKLKNNYWNWQGREVCYENIPRPKLPIENAMTALAVIERLQNKLPCSLIAIQAGIAKAFTHGRLERFSSPFNCILDVAHNPEAANYLAKKLQQQSPEKKRLAVFGMMQDKDIENTLKPLIPLINHWFPVTLETPRSAPAETLAKILKDLGAKQITICKNPLDGWKKAGQIYQENHEMVVFGSFYAVAPLLQELKQHLKIT